MTFADFVVAIIAFAAPYLLFQQFWPPFDLRLDLNRLGPITRFLCKHLRAMIFLCCLASLSIFLMYRWKGDSAALTLFFAYLPFFCLLLIPAAIAFRQSYNFDGPKRGD